MKNKKWIGLIVAVLLCILAIPAMGLASGGAVEVSTETALKNAITNATDNVQTTIKLTGDINLDKTVEIPSGKKIVLDLNGHVLNGRKISEAKEIGQSASVIRNSGNLTIEDNCTEKPEHYFTVIDHSYWSLYKASSWVFYRDAKLFDELTSRCDAGDIVKIMGGVITGGRGTVTSKTGNVTTTSGGAIDNESGSNLTLNSGAIVGNLASYGGGINSSYGNVIINGGTIVGNGNLSTCGGGICCSKSLEITGGTISQNTAQRSGGIELCNSIGSYTINGGTISYNYALNSGGGIDIHSQATLKITNGTISGNIAGNSGGGVCIEDNSSTFLKVGGAANIVGNTLSDSTPSNVHCMNDLYPRNIIIDSDSNALSAGAYIGITSKNFDVFAEGANPGDEQYFFSDDPSKRIVAGTTSGTLKKANYSYTISNDESITNGTITVKNGKAHAIGGEEGDIITVIPTPDVFYELEEITAWKTGTEISVNVNPDGTFTMPDADVTVSATFKLRETNTFEVYSEGTDETTSGTLKYALAQIKPGDTIKLMADIDLKNAINTVADNNFILDLNGQILSDGSIEAWEFIDDSVIINHGTLTIKDSDPNSTHSGTDIKGGMIACGKGERRSEYGGAIINEKNAIFTLEGGTITGGDASYGGAIYSRGTSVTISGGTITGNRAGLFGGGVYIPSGSITISGGTISNNHAGISGGGISRGSTDGNMTITGGTISNNTSDKECGGVDCNKCKGQVVITGGTITGNKAQKAAGGISGITLGDDEQDSKISYSGCYIVMGGNVIVKDNTLNDGTPSNIDLRYHSIKLDSETKLSTDATIGITGDRNGVFATDATEGDENRFTSDAANKHILYYNKTLELVNYSYSIRKDVAIINGQISDFRKGNTSVTGGEKGDTIKVFTIANTDYVLDTITVWKTGTPSQKVTVNADGTFTMPDYDVTVSATFKGKSYPITTVTDGKGTVSVTKDGKKVTEGEYNATHTVNVEPDFKFYKVESIIVYKTGDSTKENILQNDYTFTMPNEGVTINATFYETEMPCPVHRFFRKVKIFFKNLFK